MGIGKWLAAEKYAIILTIAIIAIVGVVYFGVEQNAGPMGAKNSEGLSLEGTSLKIAFADKNALKVFALAPNNELAKYSALEGNPLPENNSIVIGEMEANMMKEEKLFSKAGDTINSFFGINTKVEGVLRETSTPADYFHFLSENEFDKIKADSNRAFLITEEDGTSLFVQYNPNSPIPLPKFAQGKESDYEEHTIVGKKYYPIIIGADEASAMQKSGEFKNLGDTITEAGKEFIVTGILAKTNSAFDMAHIVPLDENELTKEAGQ